EKINNKLPGLDDAKRDEELALWKDLLYQLVIVEDDNRALTIIRSEEELRKGAEELDCKVDFEEMMAFLVDDNQRILRKDPRNIQVPESQGNRNTDYYSLGHDAIAAALSKWRETRSLVLGRRRFVRKVSMTVTRSIAVYAIGSAVLVALSLAPSQDTRWLGIVFSA